MTQETQVLLKSAPETKRNTRTAILVSAARLVALHGCHGIGMRDLSKAVGVTPSVVYHYFTDKDAVLLEMYLHANKTLGIARANLKLLDTTEARLRQLIHFQLTHAELISAVLRYYLFKREVFHQLGSGTLPEKATLHVEEVLQFGVDQGEIKNIDIPTDAKVIAHVINGYILEYYPYMPTGKIADDLVDGMVRFTMQSLTCEKKSSFKKANYA